MHALEDVIIDLVSDHDIFGSYSFDVPPHESIVTIEMAQHALILSRSRFMKEILAKHNFNALTSEG